MAVPNPSRKFSGQFDDEDALLRRLRRGGGGQGGSTSVKKCLFGKIHGQKALAETLMTVKSPGPGDEKSFFAQIGVSGGGRDLVVSTGTGTKVATQIQESWEANQGD